eukprot:gene2334-8629_t
MAILEVCIDSVAGAVSALRGGASRVELCQCLIEGGLTPSAGLVKQVRAAFPHPGKLHVLIRPRGGDFLYSEGDVQVMLDDIEAVAALGADAVVVGALKSNGDVDLEITSRLLEAAKTAEVGVVFPTGHYEL